MSLGLNELYMILGFALSAYAIVANDSIQTLVVSQMGRRTRARCRGSSGTRGWA